MITNAICWMKVRMARDEGATMVEYSIMVALIAIVSILVVTALGTSVGETFDGANTAVDGAAANQVPVTGN